jgi:hypothetical protein
MWSDSENKFVANRYFTDQPPAKHLEEDIVTEFLNHNIG